MAVLAAASAAYASLILGSYAMVRIGPFQIATAARPSLYGITEVAIPPLGRVRARTHWTPLSLQIRLDTVDVRGLARLAEAPAQEDPWSTLRSSLTETTRRFALRLLVVATAGGAVSGLLWREDRRRRVAAGAVVGLLSTALLIAVTQRTYDPEAFRHAEFSGALSAAPWLIDVFTETPAKVEEFNRQMNVLVTRLYGLYRGLETTGAQAAPQDEGLRVLVVGDLHNNPAGVRLVREFVASFQPDWVLDVGDVADWGTAPEAGLVAELERLPVPYYVVPGNHDSPQSLSALQRRTGAQVIDGLITLPGGVLAMASRDPSSYRLSPALASPREVDAQQEAASALLAASPRRPDLLVVHNPQVAQRLRGQVPVVITGHTHVQRVDDTPGGLLLNPGSTGAAGLRGLVARREIPYGLLLLTLMPAEGGGGWRAVTVDAVQVYRLGSTGFTLQRYVVDGRPDTVVSFHERPPFPLEETPP